MIRLTPSLSLVAAIVIAGAVARAAPPPKPAAQAKEPSAQSATLHGDLTKDWTAMTDRMAKMADAMPEDKFGFKPTPAQRSFGEQMLHVASANIMLAKTLGAKAAAPTINDKATAKADILKALADSFAYGAAALKEQTNATLLQTVAGPPFMGPSTRARIVYALLGHAWDEYGV